MADRRRPGGLPTAPSWLVDVPLAHRGLHGDGVPENSLAAFAAAREAGVGVELDVWLAADGVPVVLHDRDLRRVADDPRAVAAVPSDELGRVRLAGSDQRVPTLAAVLDVLGDAPVMVEVKNPGTRAGAVEAAVVEVAADHAGPWCIASFNPRSVAWFAVHAPDVVRVQTAGSLEGLAVPPPLRWALRTLRFLGSARPHAVSYDLRGLAGPAVQRYRREGGAVLTWTVRTEADLTRARSLADNVIFESLPPDAVLA